MFVCRACLRRGLGALPYSRTTEARLISSLRTIPGHGLRRRTFATVNQPLANTTETTKLSKAKLSKAEADEQEDSPAMKRLEWVVNKHLQYLKDPKLIADHVKATLKKDRYLEALLLVRKASRNTKVTVSWNHLIDFQMKAQRLHASIKLYNEMKKRGQTPDATTYTIIFRGCAQSQHPKLAVSEALKIYNKMISIGNIKPNTIHFNAVLDVCSRAHDIESLFTVVSTANDGLRNPNNQSYTIILNALRFQAGDTTNMSPEDIRNNTLLTINRARMIWEEVMERWRSAQINVDEELVCAMGRILTTGDKLDNDSIMELLEQTMQIPNFNKAGAAAAAALSEPTANETPSSEETITSAAAQDGASSPEQPETTPKPATKPQSSKAVAVSRSPRASLYPKPGNNTLSLILLSLHKTGKTTLGPKYWDYLTKTLNVVPDKDNYLHYLRVLCKGRASAKAAEVIPAVPIDLLNPMFYRLAFTCCIHDRLNQTVFEHAKVVFRDMAKRLRIPDAISIRLFLTSARANFAAFQKERADEKTSEATKLRLCLQLLTALDMIWAPFRVLIRSFIFPQQFDKPRSMSFTDFYNISKHRKQEMLLAARKCISAYDTVLHGAVTPPKGMIQMLAARKRVLVQLVERYTLKMQQAEREIAGLERRLANEKRAREEKEDKEDKDAWREVEKDEEEDDVSRRGGDGEGDSESSWPWPHTRQPLSVYEERKPTDRLRRELGERL